MHTTPGRFDLALFAGIGFAEGTRLLGRREVGLELAATACATRQTAGHATIRCDVAAYPVEPFEGRIDGFTAGPPCPPFSKAGLKAGIGDIHHIARTVRDLADGHDTRPWLRQVCTDPRSPLTAEPMRWLHALRPAWVVLEQVPAVLPLWELYAEILRGWGYSAVTGVVDAADYGAAQHRKRAALIASRHHAAALPAPTHGPGLTPYATMAQAIGWGYTTRPAPTVTGGGTATGGAEPFGNGSRRAMARAAELGLAVPGPRGWRPSIADCARLQGFRPDIQWHGNNGAQYLAIGNALPVPLATALTAAAAGHPASLLATAA